jgi:hypothetical protein
MVPAEAGEAVRGVRERASLHAAEPGAVALAESSSAHVGARISPRLPVHGADRDRRHLQHRLRATGLQLAHQALCREDAPRRHPVETNT